MGSAKGKEIKISEEAINIYRAFKQKEGSEQIAGPITIQVILNICQNNPKRILEMGGGIGTISYTLLKNSDAFVDIYEVDDFCLNKLKENLSGLEGRYQIIENYRILPPQREYDLIIVDGGIGKDWDKGFASSIWFYIHYMESVKLIYIEGKRPLQRIWARKALKSKYIYKLNRYFDIDFGEDIKTGGGLEIICWPCKFWLIRWLSFLYWELREWTSIKFFILYRFNKIKKMIRL